MEAYKNNPMSGKELTELKELKRKNRRRNAFLLLTALQTGAMLITYYLGRSHNNNK